MSGAGHCLCGRVRFAFEGDPLWVAHCHCESCRRATASAFTTYIGVPAAEASFTGDPPKTYASSPGALRRFCGVCGAQVSFESDRWPGEIHFFAALLDDPLSVTPQVHVNVAERLAWIALDDGLPCKAGTDG
jgi:hypothetical protein